MNSETPKRCLIEPLRMYTYGIASLLLIRNNKQPETGVLFLNSLSVRKNANNCARSCLFGERSVHLEHGGAVICLSEHSVYILHQNVALFQIQRVDKAVDFAIGDVGQNASNSRKVLVLNNT